MCCRPDLSLGIFRKLFSPLYPAGYRGLTRIVLYRKSLLLCKFIVVINNLFNDLSTILLVWYLVIRQKPERMTASLAFSAFYKSNNLMSTGLFLASFYPVLVDQLPSALRTAWILIALYLKDLFSSLYSS